MNKGDKMTVLWRSLILLMLYALAGLLLTYRGAATTAVPMEAIAPESPDLQY